MENNSLDKSNVSQGTVPLEKQDISLDLDLSLPQGVSETIDSLEFDNAPSEASSKKASENKGGGSGSKSFIKTSEPYVVINGKQFTKQMLVSEIRSEVELRIKTLKKELKAQEKMFTKFSAKEYQKQRSTLRVLEEFVVNFIKSFKQMAIEKLKSMYEVVVLQKGDPIL